MKLRHIVGTRPNFTKIAPIGREMAQRPDAKWLSLTNDSQR
jgi:UDP-N-acetylglucosamine 2-epimerase